MTTQLLSAAVEQSFKIEPSIEQSFQPIGAACRGRVLLLPRGYNINKTLSFLHSFKILVTLRYQLMRLLNDRTGLA